MLVDTGRFDLTQEEEERLEMSVGPPGAWRRKRDDQMRILEDLGLRKTETLLDLGCGVLRAGIPLIAYLDTGKYTGVDIDEKCISVGRELVRRFELDRRNPNLVVSRSFGREELSPYSFDRVWAFNVLIHLEKDLFREALSSIQTLLRPGGSAWATVRVDNECEGFKVTGRWKGEFPITAASESYFEKVAAENGLDFRILRPVRRLEAGQRREGPVYMVAEFRSV